MKTPRAFALVTMAALASLAVSMAWAQTPVVPPPPPLPPPPAAQDPRTPAPVTAKPIMLGSSESSTTVKLHQNTSLTMWSTEVQMNNYYFNIYVKSSEGEMMDAPTMTAAPDTRLVLTKEMKINGETVTAAEAYRLDKLELIGLAKHDAPVVYTINCHPPLRLVQDSPDDPPRPSGITQFDTPIIATDVRPLTDFEKTSLEEIKKGKNVVSQPEADGKLLIVGAVRAQASCILCHTGYKSGDALGAFSYRLSKVNLFGN